MHRAPLLLLLLSFVGSLAAEGHKPPRLPTEIDGQSLTEHFAGRLVYLPQQRLAAQRLLRRWNAQELARGGSRLVPGLRELYGPAADPALAGWALEPGRTHYAAHPGLLDPEDPRYGDPGYPRFDLWQSDTLPGVYVLVLPGEDLRAPLQAFVDELWLIGHQEPPRPSVTRPGGLAELWRSSGLMQLGWKNYIMILGVGFLLLYLGIVKGFEPLLLVPMATGCILVNAVGAHMADPPGSETAGILGFFYAYGIESGIFPLLIFLGVGALTDFGPLLANPWSALLGGAAQFGIFGTFFLAIVVSGILPEGMGFSMEEAAALAIIGGADGPTSIFVASRLAPQLLGAIAVAAYSYMALVPILQPPVMRLLTNDDERKVMMQQRKEVSRTARVLFPIATILLCILFLPDAVPLIGMLMFGNLLRECRVTERLLKAAQNELINLVTIGLGLSVGTKLAADSFLDPKTLLILVLGCAAFMVGTAAGVLFGKLMHRLSGGRINPLIGAAGVSAVPMAARVVQIEGQRYNKRNFLLMHAMGPNVAGVIGSATAAGILLACFGG